jgi:hypothetical protein
MCDYGNFIRVKIVLHSKELAYFELLALKGYVKKYISEHFGLGFKLQEGGDGLLSGLLLASVFSAHEIPWPVLS